MGADDEVLMARFTAGDDHAFEELYDRYERALYLFCLRLLGGDEDRADDAFQDTFMTLVDRRHRYRDQGGRFRGWLFTIARNTCLDRARRDERRAVLRAVHHDVQPARTPAPDIRVAVRDEVSTLLAHLPSEQREILLLHRQAGFSYAEIAGMHGSSEAAVKQKAYRALRALREVRTGAGARS